MLPIAQQIPVDQQPKAVIRVPTRGFGVGPLRAVGGRLHRPVQFNLDRLRLAYPARDHPDPALRRPPPRILQDTKYRWFGFVLGTPDSPSTGFPATGPSVFIIGIGSVAKRTSIARIHFLAADAR